MSSKLNQYSLSSTKKAGINLDALTEALNVAIPDLKIPAGAEFTVVNDEGNRFLEITWNEFSRQSP